MGPKLLVKNNAGKPMDYFNFVVLGAYSLKGNETREHTFAIQITPKYSLQSWIDLIPESIETANTVGVLPLEIVMMPKIQVSKDN